MKNSNKWIIIVIRHPRDDVDRLYVSGMEGGRGLAGIEDSVYALIQRFKYYIEKHEGGLTIATKNDTDNVMSNRMTITKKIWKERQLYGRFKLLINNILLEKTWTWLRKGDLKRETESLQIAAQNNAIRTNHIKAKIDKTQQNSKCRLCGDIHQSPNKRMQQISTEGV